jgi:hypothetical protein
MKYFQWVMGGNGGLLPLDGREKIPALDAKARTRAYARRAGRSALPPIDPMKNSWSAASRTRRESEPPALAANPLYT